MTALPTHPGPTAAECCAPAAGLDPALDADRLIEIRPTHRVHDQAASAIVRARKP